MRDCGACGFPNPGSVGVVVCRNCGASLPPSGKPERPSSRVGVIATMQFLPPPHSARRLDQRGRRTRPHRFGLELPLRVWTPGRSGRPAVARRRLGSRRVDDHPCRSDQPDLGTSNRDRSPRSWCSAQLHSVPSNSAGRSLHVLRPPTSGSPDRPYVPICADALGVGSREGSRQHRATLTRRLDKKRCPRRARREGK